MSDQPTTYAAWVGATESRIDDIDMAPVQGALAMLDDTDTVLGPGDGLPPLWHWFYFLPRAPQSQIGPDGHPQRGGFMPPVAQPRRMFAGARLKFHLPLVIGKPATRHSTILSIAEKHGGAGNLVFVTVGHRFEQNGRLCLEEEQDIVYKDPGGSVPAPVAAPWPEAPAGAWTRTITPDPVLLFRFSAMTFNAHRIHYDRAYAMGEEGYPGLVVHGPLTAMLLMDMVRRNANQPVTGFSFRGKAPLFDLAPFRLLAMPGGPRIDLEAQGPDGKTTMSATVDLG